MICAPSLGRRYWVCLCLASVLGANLGDVISRELGLGYWRGLPVLAALFGCIALAARFSPRVTTWYWLAIILVRAAATNFSDWQVLNPGEPPTVKSPWSFPIVITAWGIALVVLAFCDRRRAADGPRIETDLWFWTTMLVAATLGTATGDWLAFRSGLQLTGAAMVSTITLVVAFVTLAGPAHRSAVAFWSTVFIVRTWTTNIGDWQADTIGLWLSTGIAATLTLAVICIWGPRLQTPTLGLSTSARRQR